MTSSHLEILILCLELMVVLSSDVDSMKCRVIIKVGSCVALSFY